MKSKKGTKKLDAIYRWRESCHTEYAYGNYMEYRMARELSNVVESYCFTNCYVDGNGTVYGSNIAGETVRIF